MAIPIASVWKATIGSTVVDIYVDGYSEVQKGQYSELPILGAQASNLYFWGADSLELDIQCKVYTTANMTLLKNAAKANSVVAITSDIAGYNTSWRISSFLDARISTPGLTNKWHKVSMRMRQYHPVIGQNGAVVTSTYIPPPSSLLTSLVSYWKLDEASGTRVDSVVASGNDLTDNNTVTQAAGKISNAGQFTSANSETLSRADNASLSTGDIDFTVAGWVYGDTLPSGGGIIQKGNGAAAHEFDLFFRGTGTAFAFRIANGTLLAQDNTIVPPSTGTWYFVVGWHDSVADTVNVQVNNNTAVSTATTGVAPTDTAAAFIIGRSVVSTVFWNGRIDEVGFWKRVLTATERTNLYNAGAGVTYPFTGIP